MHLVTTVDWLLLCRFRHTVVSIVFMASALFSRPSGVDIREHMYFLAMQQRAFLVDVCLLLAVVPGAF